MRLALVGAAVISAVLITVAAVTAAALAGPEARAVVAGVELRPDPGSGARGAAFFRQRGRTLTGWVVVWGLEAGTRHAVHFHGPRGACRGIQRDAVAAHADLVADEQGVAFRRFSTRSRLQVLRRGFYYNVHERSSVEAKSASIACGDIVPSG